MAKKFILIILLLFTFINRVQALEKEQPIFAGLSNNEIIFHQDKYLIVGNVKNDFNSIKYFANEYCSNSFGENYISVSIPISLNIAYIYCTKIDELYEFKFSNIERDCFLSLDSFFSNFYDRECMDIDRDFESLLLDIKNYRDNNIILSSDDFVYQILTPDIEKKISDFETKISDSQRINESEDILKRELSYIESSLSKKINIKKVEINIALCKRYGFKVDTDLYFKCILGLIE